MDFYQSTNVADYWSLISCKFASLDHLSSNFVDFLKECLQMDVNQRQTATSLLAHPVFTELNAN